MSDEPNEPSGEPSDSQDAEDEARKTILARRRRFVAVALASAGVASAASSCDKNPLVCLSPVPVQDDGGPMVCLSAPPDRMPEDAGAGGQDAGVSDDADAGAGDADVGAGDADAGAGDAGADAGDGGSPPPPPPRVCLRAPPPPKPQPTAPKPCLKFAPPDVDKKKI